VDSVGGQTLANVCGSIRYGGLVTACGMAGGLDLPTNVLPFILRGITLAGIDSVHAQHDRRVDAWQRLAGALPPDTLASLTETIELDAVPDTGRKLLAGSVRGRIVVDLDR
jgi:acrylyl-CoA reductase (NADPH)